MRPEVRAVAEHIEVEAGHPAELACEVTRGSPEPEIVWRRQVIFFILFIQDRQYYHFICLSDILYSP